MQHQILYRPSHSLLVVQLEAGESLAAETGAMVSMSANVQIETAMRGGFFGALAYPEASPQQPAERRLIGLRTA
jgi:uncharacterized protein (AIM24 family)